ncbi:hypothetical protein HMPREF3016_10205 [Rothia sp. HMSC065D02]|nr:hypothetical protein HMPREF3016_10205 [Rothia sp. HMSC065D02]
MLQALLARQTRIDEGGTDLSDLVAVVVRYFGGIKLGAGGLVRAYTDAVVQTLDNAHFDSRERMRVGTVLVSLAEAGRVENEIRASGIEVLGTDYLVDGAQISLCVFDREQKKHEAQERVIAITSGQENIVWGDTRWVDIPCF